MEAPIKEKYQGLSIGIDGQDMTGKQTITDDLRSTLIMLTQGKVPVAKINFPNYQSAYGRLANDYLFNRLSFEDDRVYDSKMFLPFCKQLLYIGGFFQEMDKIRKLKEQGAIIIYDRNWMSAWAFAIALGLEDARIGGPGADFPDKESCVRFYLDAMHNILRNFGEIAKMDYFYVLLRKEGGYAKSGLDKHETNKELQSNLAMSYSRIIESKYIKEFADKAKIIQSEPGKSRMLSVSIIEEIIPSLPKDTQERAKVYVSETRKLLEKISAK